MPKDSIPKKIARLFRIVHGFYGVLFISIGAWILATSGRFVRASIFFVIGAIGIINAAVGWLPTKS